MGRRDSLLVATALKVRFHKMHRKQICVQLCGGGYVVSEVVVILCPACVGFDTSNSGALRVFKLVHLQLLWVRRRRVRPVYCYRL